MSTTFDNTIRPRRTHPIFRLAVSACIAASAVACVLFLRDLKKNEDSLAPREPSIEIVRTDVQRGIDAHATGINTTPLATSFSHLRSFERPPELIRNRTQFSSKRIAPLETQVWTFNAKITEAVIRSDKDLYLIIEADGLSGCVEVPAPEHCKGSVFEEEITSLRRQLEAELRPSRAPTKVNRHAQLTGVGFFGTAGKKENGARLLPLLQVRWLD